MVFKLNATYTVWPIIFWKWTNNVIFIEYMEYSLRASLIYFVISLCNKGNIKHITSRFTLSMVCQMSISFDIRCDLFVSRYSCRYIERTFKCCRNTKHWYSLGMQNKILLIDAGHFRWMHHIYVILKPIYNKVASFKLSYHKHILPLGAKLETFSVDDTQDCTKEFECSCISKMLDNTKRP